MNLRALSIFALVLIAAMTLAVYAKSYHDHSKDTSEETDDDAVNETTITYTFRAHVKMDESGSVLVPVTAWILPGNVWVESGNATLAWVDTEHGKGLRIDFEGPVELRSSVTTVRPIEDWNRLTMEEENGTHARIHYETSGSPPSYTTVRFYLEQHYSTPHAGWHLYWIDAPLVEGWNTYPFRELLIMQ